MYCKKCGALNDKDAVFCSKCGTRLINATATQPRPNVATSAKKPKRKFPVKIVVSILAIIAIAAVVFSVSSVLSFTKNGRKNYEDVIKQYFEAFYDADGEKLLSLYPQEVVDEIFQHSKASKEDVYKYYSSLLEEPVIHRYKDSIEAMGGISFEPAEPYSIDGIKRSESAYIGNGINLDIEDGLHIEYSFSNYDNNYDKLLTLIKVGGRWYVDDYCQDFKVYFWQDFSKIPSAVQALQETDRQNFADGDTRNAAFTASSQIETGAIENRSTASFSDIADLEGMTFTCAEESVLIELGQNGQFKGRIHLSSYGSSDSIYVSDFYGSFTDLEKIDDYTYTMRVSSLEYSGTPGDEEAIGEYRYIYSDPSKTENPVLDVENEFYLYLPGSAVENLPEEFLESVMWQIAEENFSQSAHLYNATRKAAFWGGFGLPEWKEIGKAAISAINRTTPAYPDGNQKKTPVSYVYQNDIHETVNEIEELAAEQKPALIKYLGCSEDNLWPNITTYYMQGDARKAYFWYIDDYREILGGIILLEDGTAAWCDPSKIEESNDGYFTGELIVNTIEKNAFKNTQKTENVLDAKELSESEQRTKIAQYTGISEEELKYCGINEAGRMEFGSNPDNKYDDLRYFLLDDGAVVVHAIFHPPYRFEND